jgi:hypothetical protein
MKIFKITLLFALLIHLSSCKDTYGIYGISEESITDEEFAENYFGAEVTRDFIGQVVDVNDNPISDVLIQIKEKEVKTDHNGIFILSEADVYEDFAYIKAGKDNYLQGSTTLIPNNGTNKVKIVLLRNTITHTIKTGVESTVTFLSGGAVKFDGNFNHKNGTPYEGTVNVSFQFIKANDNRKNDIVGIPYANGKDGVEQYLESYGILGIRVTDDSENELILPKDSFMEVMIPVESDLIAGAPKKMNIWSLNKEYGFWKIAGDLELHENNYMGKTDQITFLNFAQNYRARKITATITSDNTDVFLANHSIDIEYQSPTNFSYNHIKAISSPDAPIHTLVPTSMNINYKIYAHTACGEVAIKTTTIPGGRVNASINVKLSEGNSVVEKIEGTFSDCNGEPIQEGYLFFEFGDTQFYNIIKDGEYSINILRCLSVPDFNVEAFDYSGGDNQKSINMSYLFTGESNILGELVACNNIIEMIQFTIDGSEKVLITNNDINVSYFPSHPLYLDPFISIYDDDSKFLLVGLFRSEPNTIGVYDNYELGSAEDRGMNISTHIDISNINNHISYTLVKIGIGDYTDIYFNGDYEDTAGVSHTITGVVHVSVE